MAKARKSSPHSRSVSSRPKARPAARKSRSAEPELKLTGLHKKAREVVAESRGRIPDRDPSSPDSAALREAIQRAFARELDEKASSDLWFHLADWAWEMEFIFALFCRPERFSPAEIREGITSFLLHAPPHITEATKITHLDLADLWSSALPAASMASASVLSDITPRPGAPRLRKKPASGKKTKGR